MSLAKQLACAERELDLRMNLYPKLVKKRKMTPEHADRETTAQWSICRTLERLVAQQAPKQGDLVGEGTGKAGLEAGAPGLLALLALVAVMVVGMATAAWQWAVAWWPVFLGVTP